MLSDNLKSYNGVNVCDAIKAARNNAGLTRQAMADCIGCTVRALVSWEYGTREPCITTFFKILEVGGLSAEDVFRREIVSEINSRASIISQRFLMLDEDAQRFVEMVINRELARGSNIDEHDKQACGEDG